MQEAEVLIVLGEAQDLSAALDVAPEVPRVHGRVGTLLGWAVEFTRAVVLPHNVRVERAALNGGVAAALVHALKPPDLEVRLPVSREVGQVSGPVAATLPGAGAGLLASVGADMPPQRAALGARVGASRLGAAVRPDT